jgi:hypothetical protein
VPIIYRIDSERRLVWAKCHGAFTSQDALAYQREVWSRPEVARFAELIDMTEVVQIVQPSTDRIRALAHESAAMDGPGEGSRLAIVAPGHLAFGLGRMYQMHRQLEPGSRKAVGVFRTLPEAIAFLGLADGLPNWEDNAQRSA